LVVEEAHELDDWEEDGGYLLVEPRVPILHHHVLPVLLGVPREQTRHGLDRTALTVIDIEDRGGLEEGEAFPLEVVVEVKLEEVPRKVFNPVFFRVVQDRIARVVIINRTDGGSHYDWDSDVGVGGGFGRADVATVDVGAEEDNHLALVGVYDLQVSHQEVLIPELLQILIVVEARPNVAEEDELGVRRVLELVLQPVQHVLSLCQVVVVFTVQDDCVERDESKAI